MNARRPTITQKCTICPNVFVPISWNQKRCSLCAADYNKKRDSVSDRVRAIRRHGISDREYRELKLKGCAICGKDFGEESPHVDHDHLHCSGRYGCKSCVRGLLCRFCNNGFVYAIEQNIDLRKLVAPSVLAYVDKFKETRQTSSRDLMVSLA